MTTGLGAGCGGSDLARGRPERPRVSADSGTGRKPLPERQRRNGALPFVCVVLAEHAASLGDGDSRTGTILVIALQPLHPAQRERNCGRDHCQIRPCYIAACSSCSNSVIQGVCSQVTTIVLSLIIGVFLTIVHGVKRIYLRPANAHDIRPRHDRESAQLRDRLPNDSARRLTPQPRVSEARKPCYSGTAQGAACQHAAAASITALPGDIRSDCHGLRLTQASCDLFFHALCKIPNRLRCTSLYARISDVTKHEQGLKSATIWWNQHFRSEPCRPSPA